MKLVRLGALFGSIVLLVATSITMINKRSELRSDQDARVGAAALIATESALGTVDRALAVVARSGSPGSSPARGRSKQRRLAVAAVHRQRKLGMGQGAESD